MTIREAIETIAFTLCEEYAFYYYNLWEDERIEENAEVEEARRVLEAHNIPVEAAQKHRDRIGNRVPEPVRFIDRRPFVKTDIDELPF